MKKNIRLIIVLFLIAQFINPNYAMAEEFNLYPVKNQLKQAQDNPPVTSPLNSDLSLFNSVVSDKETKGIDSTRRFPASVRTKLKKTYKLDEKISVVLNNAGNDQLQAQLLDNTANQNIAVSASIDFTNMGGTTTVSVLPQKQVRPGKYTLVVSGINGKILQQNFVWGVLAINTNKSIYLPNEKAKMAFAVLDENGNMVCEAKLKLTIQNQDQNINDTLSTENNTIIRTEQCYSHDFSLKPDFEASYPVKGEGIYTMTLTAETAKGSYTIADSFIVRQNVPFEIERISATRIYPPNTYPVIFKIKANQDFNGTLREAVPETFSSSPMTISVRDLNDEDVEAAITAIPVDASQSATTSTENINTDNIDLSTASDSSLTSTTSKSAAQYLGAHILNGLPFTKEKLLISIRTPFRGSFPITQHFGSLESDPLLLHEYKTFGLLGHDGADFGLPKGTPVIATDIGTIIFAGPGDYGNTIVIQHSWGRSYYGHLSEVGVSVGQLVNQGDYLGLSGNTGLSTGPHLHFGIKPNDYDDHNGYFGKVDPLLYLNTDILKTGVKGNSTAEIPDNLLKVATIDYPLTLKKGQTIQIEYKYQAPRKSPEMYLLGPVQMIDTNEKVVFEEARQWMIASDATWYNSNWSYRKLLTFNTALISGTTNSQFPTLISIASDSNISSGARSDGFDIVFTDSGGSTKLSAERMSYSTGTLLYWVKVPTVTSAGTSIYIYYGNPSSCDQTTSGCDGAAYSGLVWSAYRGVWHMESSPTTAESDSTTNALHLSFSGSTWASGNRVTGVVGSGLSFPGTANNILHRANSSLLDPPNDFSYTGWLKVTAATSNFDMYFKHVCDSGCSGDYSYRMWVNDAGGDTGRQNASLSLNLIDRYVVSVDSSTNSNAILRLNTWGLVHDNRFGGSWDFFMNGGNRNSVTNVTTSTLNTANQWLCLGADCNNSQANSGFFRGVMDEIRLSGTSQTSNWVSTEYNNMNNPTGFISTIGAQECATPPATVRQMRHGKYFDACGRHGFSF